MHGYHGKVDWNLIREIKEERAIPIIGNGDISSCFDAKKMFDETNCDAVMIGRGVLGNPWLIKECVDFLEYDIQPEKVSIEEKMNMLKKHVDLLINYKNERKAMMSMRTHASYYIKNLPNNMEIKEKIVKISTKEELINLIDDYLKTINK